jgi:hypothetical protein
LNSPPFLVRVWGLIQEVESALSSSPPGPMAPPCKECNAKDYPVIRWITFRKLHAISHRGKTRYGHTGAELRGIILFCSMKGEGRGYC